MAIEPFFIAPSDIWVTADALPAAIRAAAHDNLIDVFGFTPLVRHHDGRC